MGLGMGKKLGSRAAIRSVVRAQAENGPRGEKARGIGLTGLVEAEIRPCNARVPDRLE